MGSLSCKQNSELRDIFKDLDTNNDGRISREEFKKFLFKEGVDMPDEEVKLIYYFADRDADGFLDCDEFIRYMKHSTKLDIKIFTKNLFADFDKNKDGLISFEEFKAIKTVFENKIDDDELKKDFDSIDADKSGHISLKEMIHVYKKEFINHGKRKFSSEMNE